MWPVVLMMVIDGIMNYTGDRADIWRHLMVPLVMGASLWIFVEMCFRLGGILQARVFPRMEASMRMDMFDYVQQHSQRYFSNHFAGSIANKISDMPQSASHLFQLITGLFLPVILALGISIVLFGLVNPLFALILGGWVAIHFAICLLFSKKCDHYANVHAEARSTLQGKIVDSLSNYLNVKLFSGHRFEKKFVYKYQTDEVIKHQKSLLYVEKMKAALGIVCFLMAGIGMNWFMLYAWQKEMITTGEVVFIFNTSWNITQMTWIAGLEFPTMFRDLGVCRQALTVVQAFHDVKDVPGAKELKVSKGEIAFNAVTFHYQSNTKLFQNKSVFIRAGEKVGLVGFSGSGKSTFVSLILRYYDVESGKIIIDGQNISEVTQSSLRAAIATIPQDASLFHRSLMENIRYGNLNATDEEVMTASKKAHCQEFIERLPEGYSTMVGERGVKLSGGQRQRIAIARAILKNAPILILDEATSALDSMTEKLIQESLHNLMEGRTTLVIAHRLSTLSGMDRILVFKEGKIVEEGSHDYLINNGGHYAEMWQMQTGGILPEKLDDEEEKEEDEFPDIPEI